MNAFIHMHQCRLLSLPWPIAIALAAGALHAGRAEAQQTCGDTSCGLGTRCEAFVPGGPAHPDGQRSRGDIEPDPLLYCTPADCVSDADCASHMACAESPRQECDGESPSCEPGESDDDCIARVREWQAEACATVTPLLCTPRWDLPCQNDASCGDKFRCDAGACVLVAADCTENADCPVTWICATINVGPCTPVAGGIDDECQYAEPPLHECVEPTFVVREDVGGDDPATPQGLGATSEEGSAIPDGGLASAAGASSGGGCSVQAPRVDASFSWVAGLSALLLLGGRALRRRGTSTSRP